WQRYGDEASAGRAVKGARHGASEVGGIDKKVLEPGGRMAGGQVRVGLVDADRDAERTRAIAALAVSVAGIAIRTGDHSAAAEVGARIVDADDLQLDVAVRSCRSAAGNQPDRNGCGRRAGGRGRGRGRRDALSRVGVGCRGATEVQIATGRDRNLDGSGPARGV